MSAEQMDLAAIKARHEDAVEEWLFHEATDDTIAGYGAHMGQMLYRLPRDNQTDDMKTSIEGLVSDIAALVDEVERLRFLLDQSRSLSAGLRWQVDKAWTALDAIAAGDGPAFVREFARDALTVTSDDEATS